MNFKSWKRFQGLKNIRGFIWCVLLPYSFLSIREHLGVGKAGRFVRKILFPVSMLPIYDLFDFYLNDKMAEWIRYRCVEYPHTSRSLATAFKDEYPHTNIDEGCQHDGHWLERYCEDYLGIDLAQQRENSEEYREAIANNSNQIKRVLKEIRLKAN